jgi:hypothetical protein
MPASTFAVDQAATFTASLLLSSGPRTKFGSAEQDISATGERKWQIEVACTYITDPGQRAQSDVISVGITGPATDPAAGIAPGSLVAFDRLRVGVMPPELGERGRVRGGRPWFTAAGIHAVNGQRPAPAGKAE